MPKERSVEVNTRYRCIVFTLNNPGEKVIPQSEEEVENHFWEMMKKSFQATYLVFQLEKGAEGTEHWQGYMEFDKQVYFTDLVEKLYGAHFERRRGSQKQAIAYCKKEDTREAGPFEYGIKKEQGERIDVKEYVEAIQDGYRDRDLVNEFPVQFCKYHKVIDRIRSCEKPKMLSPEEFTVELHYGAPGTGKTRQVFERFGFEDVFVKPIGNNMWFNGYVNQKVILIDDFSGQMRLVDLLRLLDIYPIQLEIKGGFRWRRCNRIIITSNKNWEDWYNWERHGDDAEHYKNALKRRLKIIKRYQSL